MKKAVNRPLAQMFTALSAIKKIYHADLFKNLMTA